MLLKEYIEKSNGAITQEKFAEKLDVRVQHFNSMVNGRLGISVKLAKKIEELTNGEVIWWQQLEFCYLSSQKFKKKPRE